MARLFRQRVSWRLVALIASETTLIVLAISESAFLLSTITLSYPGVFARALLVAGVCQLCLYFADLYDFRVLSDRRETFIRLMNALGAASALLAVMYFLVPSLVVARGAFAFAALLVMALVGGWRGVFERF